MLLFGMAATYWAVAAFAAGILIGILGDPGLFGLFMLACGILAVVGAASDVSVAWEVAAIVTAMVAFPLGILCLWVAWEEGSPSRTPDI